MARGSGALVEFRVDERPGVYQGRMEMTGPMVCHKYH